MSALLVQMTIAMECVGMRALAGVLCVVTAAGTVVVMTMIHAVEWVFSNPVVCFQLVLAATHLIIVNCLCCKQDFCNFYN